MILNKNLLIAQNNPSKRECKLHLHGRVIDGETMKVIEDAVITIPEINKSLTTNSKGLFQFENICTTPITLICEHYGYKQAKLSLDLNKNQEIELILHTNSCELESVIIMGAKKSFTVKEEYQLKGIAFEKSKGQSLGQSLQELPGVYAIQTGPTIYKPLINGLYGQRILILNNGVRQEGQQWGSEHAPEIDPFIATKISVIKGAQSVRYGSDAIGGVVLVEAPELRKKGGWDSELNIVGQSNSRLGAISSIINYGNKKIQGLSMRIQGTLKQAGNTRTPNYWLDNTGFKEYNFSWGMGYEKEKLGITAYYSQFNTQLGIFRGSHFGNTSDLQAAILRTIPNVNSEFSYEIKRPYQEVMHELIKLKGYWKISSAHKIELDFARQFNYRAEYDTDRPYNNSLRNLPEMKFGLTTHTLSSSWNHQFHSHLKGTMGIVGMKQGNTSRSTLGSFFIPNFLSYNIGVFIIESYSKNNWEVEAGVRFDYRWLNSFLFERNINTLEFELKKPILIFKNPSFSLGATWQPNSHVKFRTNLGSAFRAPNVNELYSNGVHHGVNAFEKGDANLKKEVAYNASISSLIAFSKTTIEISTYHNLINDYIYLAPQVDQFITSIRGAMPLFAYKQTDASFTGIDLSVTDSLFKNLAYSGKLSMLKAENKNTNEGLILTPNSRVNNTLTFHTKNLMKLNRPFLGIGHSFVAQKTNVPLNSDFLVPPPAYHLWNIDMGFEHNFSQQKLSFILSINNLFNKIYRDYLDRFRYFNDATGINFSLRIKYTIN